MGEGREWGGGTVEGRRGRGEEGRRGIGGGGRGGMHLLFFELGSETRSNVVSDIELPLPLLRSLVILTQYAGDRRGEGGEEGRGSGGEGGRGGEGGEEREREGRRGRGRGGEGEGGEEREREGRRGRGRGEKEGEEERVGRMQVVKQVDSGDRSREVSIAPQKVVGVTVGERCDRNRRVGFVSKGFFVCSAVNPSCRQ